MMRILFAVLFSLLTLAPAYAAEQMASEASIRELLVATDARKLIDSTLGQMDALMQRSMNQAMAGQPVSAEQQKIMDEMRPKMVAIMKESMGWDVMEPMFIEIYQKSFTEKEIQGMLDFYKSDAGKAVIAKMPLVMQNTMQAMQVRMGQIMPKIAKLEQDTIAQIKASKKK